jgi:DNA-binding NarL/FixJ family response regulator
LTRARKAQPTSDPIRLVMVESRSLLGVGLREILDREQDIEVVAQVATPEEALQVVDEVAPDVVLVNAALPDSDGEATRRLRLESGESAFVVVGSDDDDASIVDAVELGAMGHVSEVAEPAELVATIRRVANGEDALRDELAHRPDLADRVVDSFRDAYAKPRPANPLTPREIEVLCLVAKGLRNREIAETLGCSEQTVKNHIRAAMHKLGAPNRTRAVLAAMNFDWLGDAPADRAKAGLAGRS